MIGHAHIGNVLHLQRVRRVVQARDDTARAEVHWIVKREGAVQLARFQHGVEFCFINLAVVVPGAAITVKVLQRNIDCNLIGQTCVVGSNCRRRFAPEIYRYKSRTAIEYIEY